jgi:hypothetical protein
LFTAGEGEEGLANDGTDQRPGDSSFKTCSSVNGFIVLADISLSDSLGLVFIGVFFLLLLPRPPPPMNKDITPIAIKLSVTSLWGVFFGVGSGWTL